MYIVEGQTLPPAPSNKDLESLTLSGVGDRGARMARVGSHFLLQTTTIATTEERRKEGRKGVNPP